MKPGIFVSCLFCQMSFVRRFNDEFKNSPYKCNKNSFNTTTWKKNGCVGQGSKLLIHLNGVFPTFCASESEILPTPSEKQ